MCVCIEVKYICTVLGHLKHGSGLTTISAPCSYFSLVATIQHDTFQYVFI